MCNDTAPIRLPQEAGLDKRAAVLGDRLQIGLQRVGKFLHPNPLAALNHEQDRDTPVICCPFEIPLKLPRGLHSISSSSMPENRKNSNILQNIGVFMCNASYPLLNTRPAELSYDALHAPHTVLRV